MTLIQILTCVLRLFSPRLCAACDEPLMQNEHVFCILCRYEFPRTNYHLDPENEIAKTFWGRVPIRYATAYFYFRKGGRVQHAIHNLKYNGQKEIGYEIGRMIGRDLLGSSFAEVDLIVAVPLHKTKMRKRGYNQSEYIANGIADAMCKPTNHITLYRTMNTKTQTRKHRYERWTSVEDVFALRNPENLANKHILLVDDVITTGATLEACATTLLMAENVVVSIVAAAMA
jgi:ComF family protein